MTEEITGAFDDGRLESPEATVHFTAWFAKYYFDAYDAWHDGDEDRVPEAWQDAFEAAEERNVRAMGNLLLGMNAHVSRDLPYVIADLFDEPAEQIDPDYALVNELIEGASATVIGEMAGRFDPTLTLAEIPLNLGAADSFGGIVTAWRTDSWQKGMALLEAGDDARVEVDDIESAANARAFAILPATRYVPFVGDSEERDEFCADAQ
jgi:hypothetical protein